MIAGHIVIASYIVIVGHKVTVRSYIDCRSSESRSYFCVFVTCCCFVVVNCGCVYNLVL